MSTKIAESGRTDALGFVEEPPRTDAGEPGGAHPEPTTVLDIMARIFQAATPVTTG